MARTGHGAAASPLLLAVVVIVGLNLRPFLTGVGPLAASVSAETGLGLQGMALLTLVPMLLMGCGAFAGPSLQRGIGARRAVVGALAVLALGSSLRLFASAGWMLVGTAVLLGLGVAIVQAVFPGIIKRQFPQHVALVMGLYSSMLMGGGAVGAQLAPLVANASGSWRIGLAWLALPALVAALMAACCLPRDEVRAGGRGPTLAFLKRPRTWLLMACFGLVNGGYSSAVAWLSPSYQAHGWTSAASGGLLAVMAMSQALSALLLPVLANKGTDRRPWLWLTLAMQASGFSGLAFWPDAAPLLWAVVVGAGLGGCFALSMVVALDHLPDPAQAGALSALMQGGGFLIAAIPPWIVALLHDRTGGFVAGWMLHLCCITVVAVLMVRLAPAGYARAMGVGGADAAHGPAAATPSPLPALCDRA
ncbi:CP family cyanate transporter-like MFS transporter [Plasticicumulans lactativorans]|uniref:CP family cyanate transporter-like MFS transporter n=1 Tax=Plasticicumulans lactativorans TaxID=1133106 RepID=A0A4V2SCS7_9GAMM|nr:cyanate transporter [Plasticicumulans lactativorans]TCO80550.1 CP family cyanate transporter-like MFS transporter [Plasticicumulans lactativorans]